MKKYFSSLSGKTVVITGASSGVGRATALALAQKGANLVLAARGEEALTDIAESCRELGVKVIHVVADTSVAEDVKMLAEQALQMNGRIDVWINNAGVLGLGTFDEMPSEILDQIIRTNLMGYMHGAHAVLPIFKRQKKGTLINNISIGGIVAAPYGAAYTASKFGLRGLTQSLQGEVAKYPDIHVCAMYPGFQRTPGIKHAANYMGIAIGTPPPKFHPTKLARAMVAVAEKPVDATFPDWSAVFARSAYAVFPTLTRTVMGSVMRMAKKYGKAQETTDGNVREPMTTDMRISESTGKATMTTAKKLGLASVGVAALWLVMKSRKQPS